MDASLGDLEKGRKEGRKRKEKKRKRKKEKIRQDKTRHYRMTFLGQSWDDSSSNSLPLSCHPVIVTGVSLTHFQQV